MLVTFKYILLSKKLSIIIFRCAVKPTFGKFVDNTGQLLGQMWVQHNKQLGDLLEAACTFEQAQLIWQ